MKNLIIGTNDLATKYPYLLKEWDYHKNRQINLNPTEVLPCTTQKAYWICQNGHSYYTKIANKVRGCKCPICVRLKSKTAETGFNDLSTIRPELLKEWNYEKNEPLNPNELYSNSGEKVWWKCEKGHEWQSRIYNRIKGTGCPYCSNKKVLEGYNDLATLFPYLLDEWNYEKNNAIGLYPNKITCGCNKHAHWKCKKCGNLWKAVVVSRTNGTGCPECNRRGKKIETKEEIEARENNKLYKNNNTKHRMITGVNDLATTHPQILIEWDYDKNDKIKLFPEKITKGSSKYAWWKCSLGHSWHSRIADRTLKQTQCPYCSNKKVLVGFNDVASVYPHLLEEWDYEKNELQPNEYVAESKKKVWWKCKYCGHSWNTQIYHRASGHNCPKCLGRKSIYKKEKNNASI